MKIRTDFVTNSSSSSFSVIIEVETVDDDTFSFEEYSYEYEDDGGGRVEFNADLSELLTDKTKKLKSKYSNVESLAKFLMDAVSDDSTWFLDEEDEEEFEDEEYKDEEYDEEDEEDEFNRNRRNFAKEIEERKADFVKNLAENVSDVSKISRIAVRREYNAWGECADLIADNDAKLCELAEKVTSAEGEDQKAALKEMLDYINTPNGDRAGEDFGRGFDDVRYSWYGDDDALLKLAERLCSWNGPDDVEGEECQELDLTTGTFSKHADFFLK